MESGPFEAVGVIPLSLVHSHSQSLQHSAWTLEVTLAIALAATNKRDNQPPVLLRSDMYCKGLFRLTRCDEAWASAPVPLSEPVRAHSMDDDFLGKHHLLSKLRLRVLFAGVMVCSVNLSWMGCCYTSVYHRFMHIVRA